MNEVLTVAAYLLAVAIGAIAGVARAWLSTKVPWWTVLGVSVVVLVWPVYWSTRGEVQSTFVFTTGIASLLAAEALAKRRYRQASAVD